MCVGWILSTFTISVQVQLSSYRYMTRCQPCHKVVPIVCCLPAAHQVSKLCRAWLQWSMWLTSANCHLCIHAVPPRLTGWHVSLWHCCKQDMVKHCTTCQVSCTATCHWVALRTLLFNLQVLTSLTQVQVMWYFQFLIRGLWVLKRTEVHTQPTFIYYNYALQIQSRSLTGAISHYHTYST